MTFSTRKLHGPALVLATFSLHLEVSSRGMILACTCTTRGTDLRVEDEGYFWTLEARRLRIVVLVIDT